MKIYRIWEHGWFCSGGFAETFDDPTTKVFSTYEKANENLPKGKKHECGETHYYIKEEEIE